MDKLKTLTLKDFVSDNGRMGGYEMGEEDGINGVLEDLKQEAIKLIKLSSIKKAKLITKTPKRLLDEIIREDFAITKAFKYFFNITDEDLNG